MKYFVAVCVSVFLISFSSFAQKINTLKHNVVKGETITQIAQKYKVTPFDIYELNPDAKNVVQLNSVLLIPVFFLLLVDLAATFLSKTERILFRLITGAYMFQSSDTGTWSSLNTDNTLFARPFI